MLGAAVSRYGVCWSCSPVGILTLCLILSCLSSKRKKIQLYFENNLYVCFCINYFLFVSTKGPMGLQCYYNKDSPGYPAFWINLSLSIQIKSLIPHLTYNRGKYRPSLVFLRSHRTCSVQLITSCSQLLCGSLKKNPSKQLYWNYISIKFAHFKCTIVFSMFLELYNRHH